MLDELPMEQGWAWYSWARANDGWEQFSGLKRSGPGYIGQEVENLLEQLREHLKRERERQQQEENGR